MHYEQSEVVSALDGPLFEVPCADLSRPVCKGCHFYETRKEGGPTDCMLNGMYGNCTLQGSTNGIVFMTMGEIVARELTGKLK